ncbi:MAG: glutamine--fructose-6-phosphate transaminase (isomerizing) [Chloroflexota bacterium]|nr:glutamine--fructose-6-phosphate transaminase (isomerizing) [Chloroflexota bacterium]
MCGIVGYIGDGSAAPTILDGLRALEYRGYDSAGLAVLTPHGLSVRRRAGRIDDLAMLVDDQLMSGAIGIGHTRWATHGAVTDSNAHPHADASGRLVIVHNGMTDNVAELRAELLADGHVFDSETDTEVIAHLIGAQRDAGSSLTDAVGRTLRRLAGAHSVVALAADEPDLLVGGRVGSAGGLVVGHGASEAFLASDLPAVVRHTRNLQVVEAGEIVALRSDGAEFQDLHNRPRQRPLISVPWGPMAAAKAGHRHFMHKEIHEQPDTLSDTIRPRVTLDPAELRLHDFRLPVDAEEVERVVIVASGSSHFAGMIGARYLRDLARLPATTEVASEFAYAPGPLSRGTLVIAISQSGATADVLLAVERAKAEGAPVVALVNTVGSELTRTADAAFHLHAGPEISVAATKTFVSQLGALYLLSCHLGMSRGVLSPDQLARRLAHIAHAPLAIARVLEIENQIEDLARRYHGAGNFLYMGRGLAHPIALEGALKLKEISYIHAEGFAAGELKHGPIALVAPDIPVVAVALSDELRPKILNAVAQTRSRNGRVILVASEGDDLHADIAEEIITVPRTPPLIAPIVSVVPLQLFAYHIAVWLGLDVDQPRNLAKSVTVE